MCQKNYEYNIFNDFCILIKRLIKLNGLTYERKYENMEDYWMRWLDFTSRYISCYPRKVIESKSYSVDLPDEYSDTFDEIKRKIELGEDVNCFQGRLLKKADVGKYNLNNNNINPTDFMWARDTIHHLHIPKRGYKIDKEGFSERSGFYLCIKVMENEVCFIDIVEHLKGNEFAGLPILEKYIKEFPEYASSGKATLIEPNSVTGIPKTDEERMKVMKAGGNAFNMIGGDLYMMGGLNAARSSSYTSQKMCDSFRTIGIVLKKIVSEQSGGINIKNSYKLVVDNSGSLAIINNLNRVIYPLPKKIYGIRHNGNDYNFYSELKPHVVNFLRLDNREFLKNLAILNDVILPRGVKYK